MSYRQPLRFRVFLSYPLLGLLISVVMTSFIIFSLVALERQFIDSALTEELDFFIEQTDKEPTLNYQKSKKWVMYKVKNKKAPPNMAFLLNYQEGIHDIEYKNQSYDLGVVKRENYDYYILYNNEDFESLEYKIIIYLVTGCFIIICLTTWYGLSLSKKVLNPILSLANDVKTLNPEITSNYLAQHYANDEVGLLALEFDAFQNRIQRLIRRERDFTGNASHELRTPLAVIIAASENLSLQKDLPNHLQQKVSRIRRSADEMSDRLNVLLTLSRQPEENQDHKHKTYLSPIINQLLLDYHDLLAAPVKVICNLHASPWVKAPNAIVAMLMGNLIKNAFIFTKTGNITIELNINSFSVTDTGCGIAENNINQVFERGFRGKNSPGSGFGLDISQRICEHYDWQININSQVGRGTCVKWTF